MVRRAAAAGGGQVTSDLSWPVRQSREYAKARRKESLQAVTNAASPGQFAYFPIDLGIGSSAKLGDWAGGGADCLWSSLN